MEPTTNTPPPPPFPRHAPTPPRKPVRFIPPPPRIAPAQTGRAYVRPRRDVGLPALVLLATALAIMTLTYFASRRPVIIAVDGQVQTLWTKQTTVRGVLVEAELTWNREDQIRPGLDHPLPADGRIVIRKAVPVRIEADGTTTEHRTQSTTVGAVLNENGIRVKQTDRVYLDGRMVTLETHLPGGSPRVGQQALPAQATDPTRIVVERSVPISLSDNGLVSTIYTTEHTLGQALLHSGVYVYLGDYVSPDLGTPVSAGESVFIRRSHPASITVDGRTINTRTLGSTVADLLAQEGVLLEGKDYTDPTPTTAVHDGLAVQVTRIREVYITETQVLTYQVRILANPDMPIDTRSVPQQGAKGEKNRLFKAVYENGKLVSRGLEREWIAKPPQDRIINYGTKIVLHDLALPDGQVVKYWRVIRMLATSYTAATSGKPRSSPEYGITFLGLTASKGIVAVDPAVVGLRSTVYVPGYGLGLAGDTGGAIKGKHIDLGFAESDFEDWYRWVDVYLLAPVPPPGRVQYTLPDYPQESRRSK